MADSQNIKDVLSLLIGSYKMEEHFQAERIKEIWFEVVGKYVANYTEKLSVKNHVLYVKLKVPELRNDMLYVKTALMQKLNKQIGSEYLQDIKFY